MPDDREPFGLRYPRCWRRTRLAMWCAIGLLDSKELAAAQQLKLQLGRREQRDDPAPVELLLVLAQWLARFRRTVSHRWRSVHFCLLPSAFSCGPGRYSLALSFTAAPPRISALPPGNRRRCGTCRPGLCPPCRPSARGRRGRMFVRTQPKPLPFSRPTIFPCWMPPDARHGTSGSPPLRRYFGSFASNRLSR